MSRRPVIHFHGLCWNEARMLPYFFRHYMPFIDKFFFLDNGSTDGSLSMLAGSERVQVRHFDVASESFVEDERRLSDEMWWISRGVADWVIVADVDEHLHHAQLPHYLLQCSMRGITAVPAVDYEMVSDWFPKTDHRLCDVVTTGVRNPKGLGKLCIFNPDAIMRSHFGPGRHTAKPIGRVVVPAMTEVKLLHYKQLGVDYVTERYAELRTGLRWGDLTMGWGSQYFQTRAQVAENLQELKQQAEPVSGLKALGRRIRQRVA